MTVSEIQKRYRYLNTLTGIESWMPKGMLARIVYDLWGTINEYPPAQCQWAHSEQLDAWETSCGNVWQFMDGGPRENRAKFCPYCGGVVRV